MARRKIGELLRDAGLIDDLQLSAALGQQKQWGGRLGTILVRMKLVTEEALVNALSGQLALPVVRLVGSEIDPEVLALIPRETCERYHLLPYARKKSEKGIETVHVAMSDPTNLAVIDELAFRTGRRVEVAVAGERDLDLAIRHHFYGEAYAEQVREVQLAGAVFRGREYDLQSADAAKTEVVTEPLDPSLVIDLSEDDLAIDEELERVPQTAPAVPQPLPTVPRQQEGAPAGSLADLEPVVVTGRQPPPALAAVPSATPIFRPGARPLAVERAPRPLNLRERLLVQTLEAELGAEGVPDRQLVLALARLLVRKGVFSEDEWAAELARK